MNRGDINLALRGKLGTKAKYLGCFAVDEILDLNLRNRDEKKILVFIVNILSSNEVKQMEHWVTIAVFNSNKVYWFDSLGLNPGDYNNYFRLFLDKYHFQVFSSAPNQLQGSNSLLCGFYALTFTHLVSKLGIPKTLQYLSNNLSSTDLHFNDFFVFVYCLKNLKLKSCPTLWRKVKPWFPQKYCKSIRRKQVM